MILNSEVLISLVGSCCALMLNVALNNKLLNLCVRKTSYSGNYFCVFLIKFFGNTL